MKKISVMDNPSGQQQCCAQRLYRFIYPKTKV